MPKTVAYVRISTNTQDVKNQKLEIYEYARKNNFKVDQFIEVESSSKKATKTRCIDEVLQNFENVICLLSLN